MDMFDPGFEVTPELSGHALEMLGELPEQGVAAMMTAIVQMVMDTMTGECQQCTCSSCVSLRGLFQGIVALRAKQ